MSTIYLGLIIFLYIKSNCCINCMSNLAIDKLKKIKMLKEHQDLLEDFRHIEDAILNLDDPYGRDIGVYKCYMGLLKSCLDHMYKGLDVPVEDDDFGRFMMVKLGLKSEPINIA